MAQAVITISNPALTDNYLTNLMDFLYVEDLTGVTITSNMVPEYEKDGNAFKVPGFDKIDMDDIIDCLEALGIKPKNDVIYNYRYTYRDETGFTIINYRVVTLKVFTAIGVRITKQ